MSRKFNFTSGQKSAIFCNAQAKSCAEPANSNDLHMANSTPKACFFIRSTRTPKERPERHSMVACSGKGSPFAVFHMSQFCSPLHVTAQTLQSLAVASQHSHMELSAMIYKFLTLTGNKRLKITVQANSKAEALSRIQFTNKPLLVARLRNAIAKNPQNMTACEGVIYA